MKRKSNKLVKISLNIFILLLITTQNPCFSAQYPEYTGEKVIDLSNKFDNRYVDSLKGELNQSSNDVRVVFLDTKGKINLSFYAPKLFEKWNMPEDSVLVVIDPYLNKIGYGIGKKVLEDMKKRKESNQESKKTNENNKSIDYDNLATAIFDKFSPTQIKQSKNSDKNIKTNNKNNSSSGDSYNSNTNNNKAIEKEFVSISPLTKKILLVSFFIILLSGAGFAYYRRKKHLSEQSELKTNYLFDVDIQKQEVSELIEKIQNDITKMSQYKGKTKKETQANIEKLNTIKNKSELFLARMESELEEIDIEDLGAIRELLDEGSLIKDELNKIHKESLDLRRDFKSTIKKAESYASDIRVNLENCKFTMESIRTIYNLPLIKSEEKINDCEKEISNINDLASQNNPLELKQINQNIHDKIKDIKKELEIIPHLYKQLQENIPISIESTLEESILDTTQRNKKKKEILEIKNNALISLSNGDLETSQELIDDIFIELNKVRETADKA
ncbi:MAG: hypothetical protein U0354_12000 [Candidatus Sericytochromatia bacterium]